MDIPSKAQIVATFDALVAEDVLVYGPHEVVEYDCEGYPVSAHCSSTNLAWVELTTC